MEKDKELLMVGKKDIAPKLGIRAPAGKAAAEVFKLTGGMAAAPRIAAVGATAFAMAAVTKIGIELGKVAMENKKIEIDIDASKLDDIDYYRRYSSSDGGFIHSLLVRR
uniref:Uncharacterized protein n=1 Tax=Tricholoma saponaceum TaxID=113602 RepID=A0A6C0W4H2_9AGAR|nr:hypothetical protein [Tricholoma saponaceum]QIC20316.1 hypothetical protein [Tricholoma saponaceum]